VNVAQSLKKAAEMGQEIVTTEGGYLIDVTLHEITIRTIADHTKKFATSFPII